MYTQACYRMCQARGTKQMSVDCRSFAKMPISKFLTDTHYCSDMLGRLHEGAASCQMLGKQEFKELSDVSGPVPVSSVDWSKKLGSETKTQNK